MRSILLLGLLMGMRHALDADHLAAVASLGTRARGLRDAAFQGAAWGLGHTLTLLGVGAACLLAGAMVPAAWAQGLEILVGVMLMGLGGQVLWRIRRRRIHVHVHQHRDGTTHLHAHRHQEGGAHDPAHHEHAHPARMPWKALAVGTVHGLAGSAALLLATLSTASSMATGLAYIGLFGFGSILGMAALSAVIALPLQASARRLGRVYDGLEGVVGVSSIAVGAQLVYEIVRTALSS